MQVEYNRKLKKNAQSLRRNMTKEERKLWYDFLKMLPYQVKRQKPIGEYIADFYCDKTLTVIELDGSQHYEKEGLENDIKRDEYFNSLGITVLRYSNYEVNNSFEAVCEDIMRRFGLLND